MGFNSAFKGLNTVFSSGELTVKRRARNLNEYCAYRLYI